uniref:Uncharacterized protein n=1 Tax=Firmicutes phage HS10 TaxID=3056392 RepID=A0AA49X4C8_9VIRU|nr:MAG: hypothetical protein [Firmicutes phage HS10]
MKRGRKKIGWTFNFARMHPVLKAILMTGLGIATMGYMMTGSWMVYALVTR